MPASRIQPRMHSAAARCSRVKKIRVKHPGSCEMAASSSMRPTIPTPSGPVVLPLLLSVIRFRPGAGLDLTTHRISQANSTDYPPFLSTLKGLLECPNANTAHDPRDCHVTYSVKEIFKTLQGEGGQAGRAAVFCRFAGCNLWTGREEDRAAAVCQFCDTDFVGTDGEGGGRFTDADKLAGA